MVSSSKSTWDAPKDVCRLARSSAQSSGYHWPRAWYQAAQSGIIHVAIHMRDIERAEVAKNVGQQVKGFTPSTDRVALVVFLAKKKGT